ncbi:MAG: type II toxin-antitoxin system Phd/YefM family antitoxin [Myxococcales bacterium]|nr:type II toxin-antitoxin system Phd/YefM family antitoxin [Myxococcales bacterium]
MATYGERRVRTISARELKNKTGEALRAVGDHERVIITRRGKPYAALIPFDDLRSEDEEMERIFREIYANAERRQPPFTPEEFLAWSRGKQVFSSTRSFSRSMSPTRKIRGRRSPANSST